MLYFAYGSNLSKQRLLSRAPSARLVSKAVLRAHALRFHKVSHVDHSAKCDAFFTGQSGDRVYGVVYDIADSDKNILDEIEGLHVGYEEKQADVMSSEGVCYAAWFYYATDIDASIQPFEWYKQHVLIGAREHDFPEDYIAEIAAVPTKADPIKARTKLETGLYKNALGRDFSE